MNGRMAFAFFAISYFKKNSNDDSNIYLSFIKALIVSCFVSVSSGAHIVLYFIALTLGLDTENKSFYQKRKFLFFFIIISTPLIIIGVIRNLLWHRFSLINLLNHGAGKIVMENITFSLAFVILIAASIFYYRIAGKWKLKLYTIYDKVVKSNVSSEFNLSFLSFPFAGLLFGYSTFLAFSPIYLKLISKKVCKMIETKSQKAANERDKKSSSRFLLNL